MPAADIPRAARLRTIAAVVTALGYPVLRGWLGRGHPAWAVVSYAIFIPLALLALCRGLVTVGFPLLDAQVSSNHLRSLGGHELPRNAFCAQVADLAQRPPWRGNWAGHFNAIRPLDLIPVRNDGASDSPASG